jgi:hypothetical protein
MPRYGRAQGWARARGAFDQILHWGAVLLLRFNEWLEAETAPSFRGGHRFNPSP